VFETRRGSGGVQAADERARELDHGVGICAERAALETFRRNGMADVDDGCEIDLDVEEPERHADDPAEPLREPGRLVAFAEPFRARQSGQDVAQPVDAPAFLIDHEERGPFRKALHLGHELDELLRRPDVPPEQHDRVRRVVPQNAPLEVCEVFAGEADAEDFCAHALVHRNKGSRSHAVAR